MRQNGEVLVQVLLLLSSTHTHTHTHTHPALPGSFFSLAAMKLTKRRQNSGSAFPESEIHEGVVLVVDCHEGLDQIWVEEE